MGDGEEPRDDEASQRDASTATNRHDVDIEDQGQTVEAVEPVDTDVASLDVQEPDPGPKGEGAKQATRTGSEPPSVTIEDARRGETERE